MQDFKWWETTFLIRSWLKNIEPKGQFMLTGCLELSMLTVEVLLPGITVITQYVIYILCFPWRKKNGKRN